MYPRDPSTTKEYRSISRTKVVELESDERAKLVVAALSKARVPGTLVMKSLAAQTVSTHDVTLYLEFKSDSHTRLWLYTQGQYSLPYPLPGNQVE